MLTLFYTKLENSLQISLMKKMLIYRKYMSKRVSLVARETNGNPNKSFSKGLSVLKEVMRSDKPLTANVLCQRLNIDKSTMSRLVTTLMNEEFLEYKGDSKEIILSDILRKIVYKKDREEIIKKTSFLLDEIFHITNEAAYLYILDNGLALNINQIDKSDRVLKNRDSIGLHSELHTSAFGKVLIAFSDEIEMEKLELKKYTNNTITSVTKLQKEVALIKERGYSIGIEEYEFGLKSVAVPYFNKQNKFVGSVGISGLSVRLEDEDLHRFGQQIFKLVNSSNM